MLDNVYTSNFPKCQCLEVEGDRCVEPIAQYVAADEGAGSIGLCRKHASEYIKDLHDQYSYVAQCPHCDCHFGIDNA